MKNKQNDYIFGDTLGRYKIINCEAHELESKRDSMARLGWQYFENLKKIPEPPKVKTDGAFHISYIPSAREKSKMGADEGWKDHLREMKSKAGRGNTINVDC